MKHLFFTLFLFVSGTLSAQLYDPIHMIEGNWKGIDMYQDSDSYDGKTFFLPNEEFIIIDKTKIRIYFYPYSKSDEFLVNIDNRQISYQIGKKKIETDYHFTNETCDTLVFTMSFINKTFVKLYHRVTSINERMEVDFATIQELDKYGFNPSAIHHLFELDTFHTELFKGFTDFKSLGFTPFNFIQFLSDQEISLDRKSSVKMSRGYKTLKFDINGTEEEIKLFHSESTQSFSIIPYSQCQCDSIVIPYLTVDWADRIRKDMRENGYKYKK